MSYALESRAYVNSFPPPFEEEYLRISFVLGDRLNSNEQVTLMLKLADVTELNLRTNDRVLLQIQNSSRSQERFQDSDEFASSALKISVRAKVTALVPDIFYKWFTRDGNRRIKDVIVHYIIEGVPPPANAQMILALENTTKLDPRKDDILTIFVAKKYRSPNKT